jgi:hypothetical protein
MAVIPRNTLAKKIVVWAMMDRVHHEPTHESLRRWLDRAFLSEF